MSTLDTEVDDYLRLRRALGHKLVGAERYLRQFTAGLDTAGTRVITMQQVLAFVSDPDLAEGSAVPQHRLMAVRGFARYLAAVEPRTQVPPAGLVTYRARRRIPYLFTDDEIDLLVAHARTSTPRVFRADTLEKMIRLLAVTGMRVGEAIRLERDDIDWSDAVIHIRDSKFNKSRHVPVSASTIEALHSYATTRDQRGRDGAGRFFVSLRGTPVDYNHFRATFHTAVNAADIGAGQPNPPRIHDLRHRFAIRTVTGWYRQGRDVEALLPRLSTYLGHRDPVSTYWYLTATAELLGHAATRLEAAENASRR
ncbi:MAG: tyrosine-type recombinase/integrase [Actinomycetota bacterium]|nr:tyrosine-type recombinase/integrase [Actinomycetota bacterium]